MLALTGNDERPVWRGQRVPETPLVSVCIPVVSEHGLIEGCLDSIAASHPAVETEMVVVANGLGDDGLISLRRRDDIVLVHSAVNAGFSGGNNLGSQYARGRYLLLLNDDSLIEAGFIDRLLSAVEREPSIAAAGGTILSVDGTLQEAGSVLWSDGWAAHVGAGRPAGSASYHYVRDTDYISANGLLVDRHAWEALGGLDERYFPAYYEDVDLCLGLRNRGYRVVYEPRARLRHLESQSTSTSFRNFLLIRNRAQLVAKWSGVLKSFSDHPDPIDAAAIDAAVLRAQRSHGRVLVVEDSADATQWDVSTVQALVAAGWSAMILIPAGTPRAGGAALAVRDRLVDLGVDVREGNPQDLVSKFGQTLEAIVVRGDDLEGDTDLQRPDGSPIPQVRRGGNGNDSVVARVASQVRPAGIPNVQGAPDPGEEIAADRVPPSGTVDPGRGAEGVDVSRRDLTFALADAKLRGEYAESLEKELAHLRAVMEDNDIAFGKLVSAFDEKERYIDSLWSVRAKKWLVGRLPNRAS